MYSNYIRTLTVLSVAMSINGCEGSDSDTKPAKTVIEVYPSTQENVKESDQEKAQARICFIYELYGREQALLYLRHIEADIANTNLGGLQYNAYIKSRNGSVLWLPSLDNCL